MDLVSNWKIIFEREIVKEAKKLLETKTKRKQKQKKKKKKKKNKKKQKKKKKKKNACEKSVHGASVLS